MDFKLKHLFLSFLSLTTLPAWANLPYIPIQFPRDEAAHYQDVPYQVNKMTEWWCYYGKVMSTNGAELFFLIGYDYMYFDINNLHVKIPFQMIQITDVTNKKVYGNTLLFNGQTISLSTKDLDVKFSNDVTLKKIENTYFAKSKALDKTGNNLKVDLAFVSLRSPLLINKIGLIDMWENTNSYYYSNTHLTISGDITINNTKYTIIPDKSIAWMDHQWGDFLMMPWNQWVWAGVQLEDGTEINLSALINPITKLPVRSNVNVLHADGSENFSHDLQIENYLPYGEKYPEYYKIAIPSENMKLILNNTVDGQDVNGTWEGLAIAQALTHGKYVPGVSYVENSVRN